MPSTKAPSTRAPSTKPDTPISSRSPSPERSPTEVTSLLPPSTSHTPNPALAKHHAHNRKASVGGRSVSGRSAAGSVRGYGAVPKTSPVHQAPRVSKAGQRRILTTIPIQMSFFSLVFLTFLSLVLSLILFLNTGMDFSGLSLPYRGSGFAEFWVSAIGSWVGLGAVISFSHPSYLFFLTNLITFILHIPLILLLLLSPWLSAAHVPLILVPFAVTALAILFALLSNHLVRRARWYEGQRIQRMLTDAAARERASGSDNVSRALLGIQGKGVWGRFVGFLSGVIGLVAGLAGLVIITLLVIDLSITAYDDSVDLPSKSSQLVPVRTTGSPWPIKVHLACTGPTNATLSSRSQSVLFPAHAGSVNSSDPPLPTIIYEPASGVPGSLALLTAPLIPSDETAINPGRWLLEMQAAGEVGRVCVWDRPGYGFSEVATNADLGVVADALWLALKAEKETMDRKFLLVGEGYGGLVTRVFAARHPSHIHSLLHLDAQTASTYFSENPNGNPFTLLVHRVATRLLPSILTPLSLARLPSALLRRSSSLSRVLASTHPSPSTEYLNENLQKARLQETFSSHSHTTSSFQVLLQAGASYPRTGPAIVVSSAKRMASDEAWAEGQRSLAEEVTAEEGLVEWVKVEGTGHRVCEGSTPACQDAVKRLLET